MAFEIDSRFVARPPASFAAIHNLQISSGFNLPKSYLDFLLMSDGGEGFVGTDGYISLWSVDSVLTHRDRYGFGVYLPEFLPIGSNGGGECLVISFMKEEPLFGFVHFGDLTESCFIPFGRTMWEAFDRIGNGTAFDGIRCD